MVATFTFPLKSSSLSNKQGEGKVLVEGVAYRTPIDESDDVYFLVPKIDRLTLTYSAIPDGDKNGVIAQLVNCAKDPGSPYQDQTKIGFSGYLQNIDLADSNGGGKVLIQAQPKNPKNTAFLRFEFSPSILTKAGMAFFRSRLTDFLAHWTTYADLAAKGRVTRIDVACDIVNASLKDMLVRYPNESKSHLYFGVDGHVETVYLGIGTKKITGSKSYAYNKRQSNADLERTTKYGGVPLTRIEARINPKISLTKLPSNIKNPLGNMIVGYPDLATPPESLHNWKFFTDSCRHRGIEGALALVPASLKDTYSKALDEAHNFWRPDDLWTHWMAALENSGLMDGLD